MKLGRISIGFPHSNMRKTLASSMTFRDFCKQLSPKQGDQAQIDSIETSSESESISTERSPIKSKRNPIIHLDHSSSISFQFNSQNNFEITRQNLEKLKNFFLKNKPDSDKEKTIFFILKKNCQNLISVIDNKEKVDLEIIEDSINDAIAQASLSLRVQAKKLKTICQELRTILADARVKQKKREISRTRPPLKNSKETPIKDSLVKTMEIYKNDNRINRSYRKEKESFSGLPEESTIEDSPDPEKQRLFYSIVIKTKLKYGSKDPCQKISISRLYEKAKKASIKEDQWNEFIEKQLKTPVVFSDLQSPKVIKRCKSNASRSLNL
ncbi:unnamed protein product [Blepharisma stoltei]|uniref:Uncharacterized protein n=1 Tax=Blepharisma stoltei TaxID=1481888 RepID=A0AAU9ILU4_9CILI|nr:unnamed protein product [Blepharisma stoltei]